MSFYTYKFRLYPTPIQKERLAKHFGSCRFVYNYFLNKRNNEYRQNKITSTYYKDSAELTKLKKNLTWMSEINSQSLQQELKNLSTAFNRFFNRKANFPKFHSKKTDTQSFCIPQFVQIKSNNLSIPKFREGIYINVHRPIEGVIKYATICMNKCGQYFVSICVNKHIQPMIKLDKEVGIDLGILTLVTCSDGTTYKNIRPYRTLEKRLRCLHRSLSRKVKCSNSRERERRKLAKLYQKISNIRSNHLHKISHKITNENQVIYLEDLNIEGMKRNGRLGKSVSDVSLSELVRQIKYKAEWRGRSAVSIGRFYPSSKTCHKCNYINQSLTLKDRKWVCPKCLVSHDRDFNAAINVLIEGRRTVGTTGLAGGPDVSLS